VRTEDSMMLVIVEFDNVMAANRRTESRDHVLISFRA
jgi:hypothetical protein